MIALSTWRDAASNLERSQPRPAGPLADIVAEAERIIGRAEDQELAVRLIGGIAIELHSRDGGRSAPLRREYKDIDLVAAPKASGPFEKLLVSLGYHANEEFNTLNRGSRGLFYDSQHGRQLDLFVGRFAMCHTIPLSDRIHVTAKTLPLADLLLMKLQIVNLNAKDVHDTVGLLLHNHVAATDVNAVNASYIAELCAKDWGLWRTCKLNIEAIHSMVGDLGLGPAAERVVSTRLDEVWARIDSEPKPRKWKLRNSLGDRVRWYQEPEEVD